MAIFTYASILEEASASLGKARRLYDDAPTPEHAALVKEILDVVEHLRRLVGLVRERGRATEVQQPASTRDEWPGPQEL